MNKNCKKAEEIGFSLYSADFNLRCFHVSVAFYKNRIISIASNSHKTTPKNLLNKKFSRDGTDISGLRGSCSESSCLTKVRNLTNVPFDRLTICTLRIDRNNKLANSYPCESCRKLYFFLGISKAFYTNIEGNWNKFEFN